MALVKANEEAEYLIKPENVGPSLNTSDWPLLLRNWDQRMYIHWKCPRDLFGVFIERRYGILANVLN